MEKGVHHAEIKTPVSSGVPGTDVELVWAGRSPEELAEEFEPSAQTIRNWVKQAEVDQGVRTDGLTSEEREELRRLRREVKKLKVEREIPKKSRGLVRSGERLDPRTGSSS